MHSWHAIESLRWLGSLSLGGIVACGLVPILKATTSPAQSISQIWASSQRHHRLTSIALTIFGAGFCAYMAGWLIPTYHLWPGMYALTGIGYVAILSIAWFPLAEQPGEHSWLHPHFIGGAATASGAVVGYISILLAGVPIPSVSYHLAAVALVYSALWPTFFLRGIRQYFLILEGILVTLFIAGITTLTFRW